MANEDHEGDNDSNMQQLPAVPRRPFAFVEITFMKIFAKKLVMKAVRYAIRYPMFKRPAVAILNRFPRLKMRVKRMLTRGSFMQHYVDLQLPMDLAQLSPHARRIYVALKTEAHRQGNQKA